MGASPAGAATNPYTYCFYTLGGGEHCHQAERLTQVAPNCYVYRGNVSNRIGATSGCPGSPGYVY